LAKPNYSFEKRQRELAKKKKKEEKEREKAGRKAGPPGSEVETEQVPGAEPPGPEQAAAVEPTR
jgi:hypothetical protein